MDKVIIFLGVMGVICCLILLVSGVVTGPWSEKMSEKWSHPHSYGSTVKKRLARLGKYLRVYQGPGVKIKMTGARKAQVARYESEIVFLRSLEEKESDNVDS